LSGKPLQSEQRETVKTMKKDSQLLEDWPRRHVKGPRSSEEEKSSESNTTLSRLGIVAVLTAFLLSPSTREGRYAGLCRRALSGRQLMKHDHVSIAIELVRPYHAPM
jgi:hypothetical protein